MTLDHLTLSEKQRTRLFIPETNRSYWDLFTLKNGHINGAPFVAPALSGLAMIYGVPPDSGTAYAFDAYPPIGATPTNATDLCTTVRQQSAQWLIVFGGDPARPLVRYNCDQ